MQLNRRAKLAELQTGRGVWALVEAGAGRNRKEQEREQGQEQARHRRGTGTGSGKVGMRRGERGEERGGGDIGRLALASILGKRVKGVGDGEAGESVTGGMASDGEERVSVQVEAGWGEEQKWGLVG